MRGVIVIAIGTRISFLPDLDCFLFRFIFRVNLLSTTRPSFPILCNLLIAQHPLSRAPDRGLSQSFSVVAHRSSKYVAAISNASTNSGLWFGLAFAASRLAFCCGDMNVIIYSIRQA
jgi:hypothetical protein